MAGTANGVVVDIETFNYHLPEALIAQHPTAERTQSRLMCVGTDLAHRRFADLPQMLRSGDLLVVNNTQVVKARLHGRKASGGRVELLLERYIADDAGLFQVRASKAIREGGQIHIGTHLLTCIGRQGQFYQLSSTGPLAEILEQHGEIPLPPYIERSAPDVADQERYQTVFAEQPGAVAAPTAGLHFDQALLEELEAMGVARAEVTLHVGAGTFQPVRGTVGEHVMHSEWFSVPAQTAEAILETRQRGGRVVAVGTTVVRTLESMHLQQGGVVGAQGDTRLFITPGFEFAVVDALITNFHLPKSTLLMLVSAFAGTATIRKAYAAAVQQNYRFFSYGDAMFLTRRLVSGEDTNPYPDGEADV